MGKSGHSRLNRVRRWIAALDGAVEVRYLLEQDGDGPQCVGSVRVDTCDADEAADQVCLAIQDVADEIGRNTRGRLVPYDQRGKAQETNLVVVGRPAEGNPATTELDGSDLARRAQDQRHYEALMRLRVAENEETRSAFRVALDAQSSTISAQQDTISRLTDRIKAAEEREQELLEQVAEATVASEDSAGERAATELALPLLVKILQSGGKRPQAQAQKAESPPEVPPVGGTGVP